MAGTSEADRTGAADQLRPSAEDAGGSVSAAVPAPRTGDRDAAVSAAAAAAAGQDLYGGVAAARAAMSGHLRRSQSAAGADRLGFRVGAGGSGDEQRLLGWHGAGVAYGAVARHPWAGAGGSSGLPPCAALDLARRLTLAPEPVQPVAHQCGGNDEYEAQRNLAGCCAEHGGLGEGHQIRRQQQHHHHHLAAAATPALHWTLLQPSAVGREPAATAGHRSSVDRSCAAERQRGWQFPWGRSRKSDSLPAVAQGSSSCSADRSWSCDCCVPPGEQGDTAAAAAHSEVTTTSTKRPSKRNSNVRRKCSQLVKAIRSSLGRRKGSRHGKHTAVAVNRRHSVRSEDVDCEPQALQPWIPEVHDSGSSGTVEAGASGGRRRWEGAAVDACAASAVESVGNGWQWHRGIVPAMASGGPAAAATSDAFSSPSSSSSLVARYPRERHHAIRLAPRSPPGPMRSLAQQPTAAQQQQQQTASAAVAYSVTAALGSAATSAAASFFSPSASGGGGSAGVRAHTTVDYAHFLVPDLRSIASSAYYWCVMDRYEAERALEGKPEGTFLLRDSAQDDFLFSVSFRRYGRSLHARVEQRDHAFSFDAHDVGVFRSPTVTGLVEHYKDADSCLFFEPLLTRPLPRPQPLSLLQLARSAVCGSGVTYDGVAQLPLPRPLAEYVRYYHYKHKVRSRAVLPATAAALGAAAVPAAAAGAGLQPERT